MEGGLRTVVVTTGAMVGDHSGGWKEALETSAPLDDLDPCRDPALAHDPDLGLYPGLCRVRDLGARYCYPHWRYANTTIRHSSAAGPQHPMAAPHLTPAQRAQASKVVPADNHSEADDHSNPRHLLPDRDPGPDGRLGVHVRIGLTKVSAFDANCAVGEAECAVEGQDRLMAEDAPPNHQGRQHYRSPRLLGGHQSPWAAVRLSEAASTCDARSMEADAEREVAAAAHHPNHSCEAAHRQNQHSTGGD